MDIDTYIQKVETIANRIVNNYEYDEIKTPMELYYLDEKMLEDFLKMIDIKKQIITKDEQWQSEMFLNKRIDKLNVDSETKTLLTSIYLEVAEKAMEIMFIQSFEKYKKDNPIFKNNNLYEHVRHDNELIDFTILNWGKINCICEYDGSYFKPNGFLKEEIIQFAKRSIHTIF